MSESRKDEKNVKKTEELRERLSDEEYERRRQIRKKRIELRRKKNRDAGGYSLRLWLWLQLRLQQVAFTWEFVKKER